ncbi:PEGA domain-containing protein [Gemmatimonas phototrophica]|uniref:PEGA domain-containing protein n=1 Tax=Gemmatimonas phototrophica TaxID=1379270 RepID=UPI0013141412|nr:PEGA domain-containing protein [Gemmatimonas phototrophica]
MSHCLAAARRPTRVLPLLLACALSACSSARSARDAGRTVSGTSAMVGCEASVKDGARLGRAALTFSGASSGEATLRIEGEAYKSTVLVDVATGTVLELAEGTYQVRITVSGYRAVERSVSVVCGKESTVAVTLNRR